MWVIMMVIILAIVWGGFLFFIKKTMEAEAQKK
ncbi:MAG: MetS family NSS transporter small subunit [Synergistetes bacterium]|nr:MetS family NSS transporter small subunit [Synergistota bacterium]